MKTITITVLLTASLLYATSTEASAQKPLLIERESQVKISGTSNLHDWHEKAEEFNVDMELAAAEGIAPAINMVFFSCIAASITSDNSIMTNKTHNALRVEKHPKITFSSAKKTSLRINNGKFSSTIPGELTINGITKQVELSVDGSLNGGRLNVKGEKTLRMSDFEIKAPIALLGTLKTGNEVTVSFELAFSLSPDNMIVSAINK